MVYWPDGPAVPHRGIRLPEGALSRPDGEEPVVPSAVIGKHAVTVFSLNGRVVSSVLYRDDPDAD